MYQSFASLETQLICNGQYSIRINDQWRICFKLHNHTANDVEIVDYH